MLHCVFQVYSRCTFRTAFGVFDDEAGFRRFPHVAVICDAFEAESGPGQVAAGKLVRGGSAEAEVLSGHLQLELQAVSGGGGGRQGQERVELGLVCG